MLVLCGVGIRICIVVLYVSHCILFSTCDLYFPHMIFVTFQEWVNLFFLFYINSYYLLISIFWRVWEQKQNFLSPVSFLNPYQILFSFWLFCYLCILKNFGISVEFWLLTIYRWKSCAGVLNELRFIGVIFVKVSHFLDMIIRTKECYLSMLD